MEDNAKLLARIKRTVQWHERKYHEKWQRFIDLYATRHYNEEQLSDQERIAVNITFAIVNVIVPAVSHNYPNITVTPQKEDYEDAAIVAQAVVNQAWRQLGVQDEVREALKDSVITGTGFVKCGYRRTTERRPRKQHDIESDYDTALGERDAARQEAYETDGDPDAFPDDNDVYLSIPKTEEAVTHDDLFVERVSPKDIFVDPDATDDKDWGYIVQRVVLPVDRVKKNPNYRKSVTAKLEGDTTSKAFAEFEYDRDKEFTRDTKRVTLYEYWDVHTKTFAVFADGCDEPLRGPEKWPYEYLPFYVFRNNTVPDEFWALGEVEAIESQQRELNKTRSQMLNQRRQYNRKVLFRQGAFAASSLDELRSDRDGVFVPVQGSISFGEAIHVIHPPTIDAQLYQFEDTIKGDITEVSSVSEYQRGQLPDIRRTATEASLIESASSVRAQDKLSRVEKFMADIARGMLCLMQEFYTEERSVRVLGPDGARVWFDYNGDLIHGEYDLQVEAGSTQPANEAMAKQDALTLYQALAGNPVANQQEALKYLLKAFKIRTPEKFMQALPPMPGQQAVPGPIPPGAEGPPVVGAEGEDANVGGEGGAPDLAALLAQGAGQVPVQGVSA